MKGSAAPEPLVALASSSPRRSALLLAAGIPFVLAEPGPEPRGEGRPSELALLRARSKAVHGRAAPGVSAPLLGVDTVVDLDGQELPKPASLAEARTMLHRLRGRAHLVHTAHALFVPATGACLVELVTARVACREEQDAAIEAYLASGQWQGKAGAYGIQDDAQSFVRLLEGAFDTVVGLHVPAVRRLLAQGCP
jgi:septum formation protein